VSRTVKVIEIDNDHRIYLYPKKIVYKEKKNGVFITKFSGVSFGALLTSSVVDDEIKLKIREIMSRFS